MPINHTVETDAVQAEPANAIAQKAHLAYSVLFEHIPGIEGPDFPRRTKVRLLDDAVEELVPKNPKRSRRA